MRTNLLLGAAAVAVLITGAIAQTTSRIERIKDPAAQQAPAGKSDSTAASENHTTNQNSSQAEPKKNVRTVYPNTQNAEQAVRESKGAQGAADASKRKPGDVTPLSTAPPPAGQAAGSAEQPAQPAQPSAPTPSAPSSAAASTAQQSAPPATPQTAPSASAQTGQPASTPASTPPQPAPAETAAQPSPPTGSAAAQPSRASSSSVIALDAQQQTSVGQAIAHRGVRPLANVSFSIAVGTKVPTSVQLRALPSDVVTFIPQYRGYSYVVVEEQIVIVDPGTHEIVAIVPYTGAAAETRTVETAKPPQAVAQKPMVSRSVNLNTSERSLSRRHATEPRRKTERAQAVEQRTVTRSTGKPEYGERPPSVVYRERVPSTVTIEEAAPSYRPAPRPRGFFDFFRGDDED